MQDIKEQFKVSYPKLGCGRCQHFGTEECVGCARELAMREAVKKLKYQGNYNLTVVRENGIQVPQDKVPANLRCATCVAWMSDRCDECFGVFKLGAWLDNAGYTSTNFREPCTGRVEPKLPSDETGLHDTGII